jgi:hypothetical protein
MKWNMGWMNDTLDYMKHDPVYRRFNHERLTFGQLYAYSENFVLPLSHDEVVHGKSSLLGKMPGDEWQRFANLRLLLAYQWTRPGKKLLFMGTELAPPGEWSFEQSLHDAGAIDAAIADLRERGLVYESEGAVWLRTTDLGDPAEDPQRRGRRSRREWPPSSACGRDSFRRGAVRCRPAPTVAQVPEINQVADQIECLEFVLAQKLKQRVGPAAACPKVDIGNPTGAVSGHAIPWHGIAWW